MKKFHLFLMSMMLCIFSACHDELWDKINDLDGRLTQLEEQCKEMNTNIESLQTIVSALQSNDYITSIVEIKKDGIVIGYSITFANHDAPSVRTWHGCCAASRQAVGVNALAEEYAWRSVKL